MVQDYWSRLSRATYDFFGACSKVVWVLEAWSSSSQPPFSFSKEISRASFFCRPTFRIRATIKELHHYNLVDHLLRRTAGCRLLFDTFNERRQRQHSTVRAPLWYCWWLHCHTAGRSSQHFNGMSVPCDAFAFINTFMLYYFQAQRLYTRNKATQEEYMRQDGTNGPRTYFGKE